MKPINDTNGLGKTNLTNPVVGRPHIETNGLNLLAESRTKPLKMN